MADFDALARSAVGTVIELARRATSVAVAFALFVGVVALVTYALGLAALQGSTRSAWVVIGAVLVVIAVGAPLLAAFRLRRIRAHAGALVNDVRTLLTNNVEAEQIVIETVEVPPTAPGPAGSRVMPGGTPALVGQSAQFTRLRRIASSTDNLRALPGTMRTIATFPALLALAALLMLVMLILALVFFLAWIF